MALLLAQAVPSFSQVKYASDVFYGREYRSGGDTLRYRILYPKGFDKNSKKKYPLVFFLHGEDGYGYDNKSQIGACGEFFKRVVNNDQYQVIVIMPQCGGDDKWVDFKLSDNGSLLSVPTADDEQTYTGELLEKLIKFYTKKKFVDDDKIHIVGYSHGAIGALYMSARNPKSFASVISVGGALDTEMAKKLKKVPVWLCHGIEDDVIPVSFSRDVFYELKAIGSDKVKLSAFPSVGHNCLQNVLESDDFLKWIFSNER